MVAEEKRRVSPSRMCSSAGVWVPAPSVCSIYTEEERSDAGLLPFGCAVMSGASEWSQQDRSRTEGIKLWVARLHEMPFTVKMHVFLRCMCWCARLHRSRLDRCALSCVETFNSLTVFQAPCCYYSLFSAHSDVTPAIRIQVWRCSSLTWLEMNKQDVTCSSKEDPHYTVINCLHCVSVWVCVCVYVCGPRGRLSQGWWEHVGFPSAPPLINKQTRIVLQQNQYIDLHWFLHCLLLCADSEGGASSSHDYLWLPDKNS